MEKKSHPGSHQFDNVSFFVAAHADDWQLFMYPHVYDELVSPGKKIIFIITTAGDAGLGEKFWLSREEGSKSSVRFCLAPGALLAESCGSKLFNDHPIHYCSINNTVSYFLRLPDGNLDGTGHKAGNFQSLTKFWSAQNEVITAIDNSTTYTGWPAFVATLQAIIDFESREALTRRIHYLNPDTTKNPGDHADHIATGRALQHMSCIKAMHQFLFVGYSGCTEAGALSAPDVFKKAGMFAAYEKAVYDLCGYSTLRENPDLYARWCCSEPRFEEIKPAG